MDAVKFIEERRRMVKATRGHLPIMVEGISPENIVKEVEEWAAAHPRKTRQDVFLEQWPDALIRCDDELPQTDPCDLDATTYNFDNCDTQHCYDCRREFWMQEVE